MPGDIIEILPGRYVPKSGTLHKYPAMEQCNLDDSMVEIRVESRDDIQTLPADTVFCQHCYSGPERAAIEHIWEEYHVPVTERGAEESTEK